MLTLKPAEEGELHNLEGFGTIKEVREIESSNVISDNNVRVHLGNEITPSLKQLVLVLESKNLRAHNIRARIKRKDVPYERLLLPFIWASAARPLHYPSDVP